MTLRQRSPRYRNPDLLALAYELDCQLQIPGVCEGGRGEPCHANWSDFGKGKSIKAHDCFFASGCRACHMEIDQGSRLTREEREAYWNLGWRGTMLALWQRGLIGVTVSKPRLDDSTATPAERLSQSAQRPSRRLRFSRKTGHCNGASTRTPAKIFKRAEQ